MAGRKRTKTSGTPASIREALKKADSYEIEGILYKLGGWKKYDGNVNGKMRIPGYGVQKAYVRVADSTTPAT